jgi:hypothetical protein
VIRICTPDLPIDFDKTTGETYGRIWQRQAVGIQGYDQRLSTARREAIAEGWNAGAALCVPLAVVT